MKQEEVKLKHYRVYFEVRDLGSYDILAESEEHAMIIGEHLNRNLMPFHHTEERQRVFSNVKQLYKTYTEKH